MRGHVYEGLTPFLQQVNQAIAQAKADNVIPTPELARSRLEALSALVTHKPEVAYVEDRELVRNGRPIKVKVYSPAPTEALPVVLFYHGGGHMCGDTELYDPMCRKIALAGQCIVVSVDYHLAPEYKYPYGLDDAEYALVNVEHVLDSLSFNEQRIVAGDSGGGALCASLVMRMTSNPSIRIDKQVLIYPSVDYTMSLPSIDENGSGYFLEKGRIAWYFDNYFNEGDDRQLASPLFQALPESCPATQVIVAGCDPLRDEGFAYANKLENAGVNVQVVNFDDMIHAFMNIEDVVPEHCAKLFAAIGQFIEG